MLPDNATIVAYLDDLYVFCDKSEVCNVIEAAQADLQRICHIDTNLGKLAVWGKNYSDPPEGFIDRFGHAAWKCDKPAEQRGIKVLGAPFGTSEFLQGFYANLVEEEARLLNLIPQLTSLQASWLLLYFCAVPRINHLLRTVPPDLIEPMARAHDAAILTTFRSLFQVQAEDVWCLDVHKVSYQMVVSQAQLPIRLAGCGLRNSVRTAPAAYWASWADALPGIVSRF